MKTLAFIWVLILWFLCVIFAHAQKITRGPEPGEIYFMASATTVFNDVIYHSVDFGETAVIKDSITAMTDVIGGISADKTLGGLYFSDIQDCLYYSPNFGEFGSWELKICNISYNISSGRNAGEIYNEISSHSIDFGSNFINHSCNGFFGGLSETEIDLQEGVAYCLTYKYTVPDTLYMLFSDDNYNTLSIKHKFLVPWYSAMEISRTNFEGKIFLCDKTAKILYLSDDYGESWTVKNSFTCPNLPIKGITGGRLDGELYLLVIYLQMSGTRNHVYIYHSLDYGETFTVYHPVSIGGDPIYADFIAEDTLVKPGAAIQFTDLSPGADSWEWDFENDGIIDSYEQNPEHIYSDTGYFSVKLSIIGLAVMDFAVRYDYIHVTPTARTEENRIRASFSVFPNPASDRLFILGNNLTSPCDLIIYDITGQPVIKQVCHPLQTHPVDISRLPAGIYFVSLPGVANGGRKIIVNR